MSSTITVKVTGPPGTLTAKIKTTAPLGKLRTAYANQFHLSASSVRLSFDGARINDNDTPNTLHIENNDTINVTVGCTSVFLLPPSQSLTKSLVCRMQSSYGVYQALAP
ncbi:ubiquitin-related domain-containing protein [Trametes maxima]|nr:ubiquitin-related domain-containing protein [Trametes maxima]